MSHIQNGLPCYLCTSTYQNIQGVLIFLLVPFDFPTIYNVRYMIMV